MILLEWAHYYVYELGFSVIPLKFRGKTPLVSWKPYQKRKPSENELRAWFHRQDRNIGIVTGDVSGGVCVIDFDVSDLFYDWSARIGGDLSTVSTGKGFHVYTQCLAQLPKTGKAYFRGQHIGEIRSNGGYVVAPPSIHPNGIQYRWLGGIQIDTIDFSTLGIKTNAPGKQAPRDTRPQHHSAAGIPRDVRDPWKFCQAALKGEIRNILNSTPDEDRNTTLFNAGLKMRRCLEVLGEDRVRQQLCEAGVSVGLPEKEVKRTLQSAWRYEPC